jgi:hypothetical protein
MKKTIARADEIQSKNIQRADVAPADGFSLVVDGHFKTRSMTKRPLRKPALSCLAGFQCCRS